MKKGKPDPARELIKLQNWARNFINNKRKQEKQEMRDLQTSVIRTATPYLVGLIVTLFGFAGVSLPEDLKTSLVPLIAFIVSTIYYMVVRFLESKYPKLGWLLGTPIEPTYKK